MKRKCEYAKEGGILAWCLYDNPIRDWDCTKCKVYLKSQEVQIDPDLIPPVSKEAENRLLEGITAQYRAEVGKIKDILSSHSMYHDGDNISDGVRQIFAYHDDARNLYAATLESETALKAEVERATRQYDQHTTFKYDVRNSLRVIYSTIEGDFSPNMSTEDLVEWAIQSWGKSREEVERLEGISLSSGVSISTLTEDLANSQAELKKAQGESGGVAYMKTVNRKLKSDLATMTTELEAMRIRNDDRVGVRDGHIERLSKERTNFINEHNKYRRLMIDAGFMEEQDKTVDGIKSLIEEQKISGQIYANHKAESERMDSLLACENRLRIKAGESAKSLKADLQAMTEDRDRSRYRLEETEDTLSRMTTKSDDWHKLYSQTETEPKEMEADRDNWKEESGLLHDANDMHVEADKKNRKAIGELREDRDSAYGERNNLRLEIADLTQQLEEYKDAIDRHKKSELHYRQRYTRGEKGAYLSALKEDNSELRQQIEEAKKAGPDCGECERVKELKESACIQDDRVELLTVQDALVQKILKLEEQIDAIEWENCTECSEEQENSKC